jgi:hypothetical protein
LTAGKTLLPSVLVERDWCLSNLGARDCPRWGLASGRTLVPANASRNDTRLKITPVDPPHQEAAQARPMGNFNRALTSHSDARQCAQPT